MCFVTIPAFHKWQSYVPHEAKGAINRTVRQTFGSKTVPRFPEAEAWTEPLETKRVVCPAFFALGPLWGHGASEWAVNPSAGGRAAQQFTADSVNVWNHWEWVMVLLAAHMQAQTVDGWFRLKQSNSQNKALNYSCWLTKFVRKKKSWKNKKLCPLTPVRAHAQNVHVTCLQALVWQYW